MRTANTHNKQRATIRHRDTMLANVTSIGTVLFLLAVPAQSSSTNTDLGDSLFNLQSTKTVPNSEYHRQKFDTSNSKSTALEIENPRTESLSPHRPSRREIEPKPPPLEITSAKFELAWTSNATGGVPALAEAASMVRPGEWLLVPAPLSKVLYRRKELNETTWGVSGSGAVVGAWSAWAWDGNCTYMHNGGHADYGGNEVYRFCFGEGWERIIDTYVLPDRTPENPCPKPTADAHGPPSAHTYDSLIWSPKTDSMFYFNNSGYCLRGAYKGPPGVWEAKDGKWKRRADLDFRQRGFARTALDSDNNIVVTHSHGIRVLDPVSGQYVATGKGTNLSFHGSMIRAPELNRYFVLEGSRLMSFNAETFQWRSEFSHKRKKNDGGSNTSPAVEIKYTSGMAWHPPTKRVVFWNGAREVHIYSPKDKSWQILPNPKGPAPTGNKPLAKWVYMPKHDLFIGLSRANDGLWLYRLPLQATPPT